MPDAAGGQIFDPVAMKKQIRALGPILSPETLGAAMKLYAPFHRPEPYAGVKVTRDVKYGPDERNRHDVFVPAAGGTNLRVLVYMHGGGFVGGDKKNPAMPYYDNVMLWAVKHGMAGINMTYRLAPAHKWPSGNEDVAHLIRWIQKHGAEHGIDPKRIYLMGQSAGASHVAQYIAHKQFHPEGGHGLKAGLLISGIFEAKNKVYYGDDESKWAGQSALPGLLESKLPLLVTCAENDPPMFEEQALMLAAALFARDNRMPWFQRMWGHNHISAMLHVGLDNDDQLGALILDFVATNNL